MKEDIKRIKSSLSGIKNLKLNMIKAISKYE